MKNNTFDLAGWMGRLMLVACLVAFSAAAALAWDISGTVTNNDATRTGRVYLYLQQQNGGDTGLGVSVPTPAPSTAFTIRGVPNGTYTLKAFVDGSGTGRLHPNDSIWSSPGTIDINNNNYSGPSSTVTFTSHPNVPVQQPSGAQIIPGDNGAFVGWDEPTDTNGNTIADSYKVYYSTVSNTPKATPEGVITVPAGDQDFAIFHYPNSTTLNIQVTALVGATESAASTVATMAINPPAAGYSISGTINLSGISNPTGNLYVALVNRAGRGGPVAAAWVANPPQASNSFTINTNNTNVPNGTYALYAFIDMDGDGRMGSGDVMPSEQQAPTVTVSGTNITVSTPITLTRSNSSPFLNTSHSQDSNTPPNENYNVIIGAKTKTETLANITVTNGPSTNGLTYPIDLGITNWGEFQSWFNVNNNRPQLTDIYNLNIQYANGAVGPDTVNLPVTAVLDSFATPTAPVGNLPWSSIANPSIYSWTAPPSPPSSYTYTFWVNGFNNNNTYSDLSSSTTFVSVPGLPYTDNQRYDWNINVQDSAGNQAQKSAWFVYTTAAPPAITTFTPASALPGATLTINGINFSTTPTNNTVTFGCSATAQATTASATQLQVVIPPNACSGSIQVNSNGQISSYSAMPLTIILPKITVNGRVTDFVSGSNITGATVTVNSAIFTASTITNGADPKANYSFANVPSGTDFTLSITATNYDPTYSGTINATADIGRSFPLYAAGSVTLWNGVTGQGVIRGRVFSGTAGIFGATVTAPGYTVVYANNDTAQSPNTSLLSTSANGVYYILNVPDSATVSMTVTASGYIFNPATVTAKAHANAVTYSNFHGYPAIFVSGTVTNSANVPLVGATITQVGTLNTTTSVSTPIAGSFAIGNLPGGASFELMLSLAGYVPAYSGWINSPTSFSLPAPFTLFTPAELTGIGITTPAKGAIIGRLVNSTNFTATLSGVKVNASRAGYPPYTVQYYVQTSGVFNPSASATDASGMFLVMNVEDGATVNINANNTAFTISGNASLTTHAPGVSEIAVPCTVPLPTWTNLQWPPSATITSNQSLMAFGWVYLNGVTNFAGPVAELTADLGYGPVGSVPSSPSWIWIPATYNTWVSGNYEYVATRSGLPAGSYDYAFRYSYFGGSYVYGDLDGSSNGYSSAQAGRLTVNAPAPTTTTLVSTVNPSTYGQAVTFTANVTPTTATGTIQFFDGATSLGSSQLTSGSTNLPISDLPSGTHSITAVYSGDVSYSGNTSVGVLQTVNDRVKVGNIGNFLTLQAAFNAAVDTNFLWMRDMRFAEDLIVNRTLPFTITLKGGLASDFSTLGVTATSVRTLKIRQGRVNVSRLVVKPD